VRNGGFRSCAAAVLASVLLLTACAVNRTPGAQDELPTASDQTDNQKRARLRLQLAVNYYEQRQYQVALDELKLALQADPNYSDAFNVRALVYMSMGELRLAEENFQQAIRLAPNNPDLSNNYGWFLCQNGKEKQSIVYFEAALKNRAYLSPVKALNNAGACSLKAKDTATAERYFLQAFQEEPGNSLTNTNLAKIYYVQGNYERARFYMNRVIKADVTTADVLWLAIKIERKAGDRAAESGLVAQLRRRHPNSAEYAYYQRGAFDE
jgi:type IV pilus assembly protein PilF